MTKIAIIISSNRPGRFAPKVAGWINELAEAQKNAEFSLVDLAEVNLPFLDEPAPALSGKYEHDHTKKWSALIAGFDGYIIVTPEYNAGYPAVLKNAIDFLYAEWNDKPVAFVTYGATGARVAAQLRSVVANVKMLALSEHVTISNYWSQLKDDGSFEATEQQVASVTKLLSSIVFWSEKMHDARIELAEQAA